MRDRLEELRQKAQEAPDPVTKIDSDPFSGISDPDDPVEVGFTTPEAVVFQDEPIIENFLSEAQHIRDEISELDAQVSYDFFPLQLYQTCNMSNICDMLS